MCPGIEERGSVGDGCGDGLVWRGMLGVHCGGGYGGLRGLTSMLPFAWSRLEITPSTTELILRMPESSWRRVASRVSEVVGSALLLGGFSGL